jgi:MFS family permease
MINDRFGSKVCAGCGCLSMALGLVLVLIATRGGIYPVACIAGIFTGIGVATTTFTPALLTAGALGRKAFSTLYSTIMVGFTVGSAVGTPLLGAIFDVSGSYSAALIAIIIAILLALVVALSAIKIGQKLWLKPAA